MGRWVSCVGECNGVGYVVEVADGRLKWKTKARVVGAHLSFQADPDHVETSEIIEAGI